MPKSSTRHNGQLTINFETLKEMFQLENPEYFLPADLPPTDDEIACYHMIFTGIKSAIAPHFDAAKTQVKTFTSYVGRNIKEQTMALVDFETPAADENTPPQRHIAIVLYSLGVHATDPKKMGISIYCSMTGTLNTIDGDLEFVPSEAKCRRIVGADSKLTPVDMAFPNNVKASICYMDSIFRCFLDGETIEYPIVQQWLEMEAFNEVAMRYDDLLQRSAGGLKLETTNDEDLDLSGLEGRVVFNAPDMAQ